MKYKPFTSKHCTPSRFTSPLRQTYAVEKKTQMDLPLLKQINKKWDILRLEIAKSLKDRKELKIVFLGKLKAIVSNPFDALKVALAPGLRKFTIFKRNKAGCKFANVPEAKKQLSKTKAFNTLSQFVPAAATADAVASAIEGDPTAIITKKLNKIKPVAKNLKK